MGILLDLSLQAQFELRKNFLGKIRLRRHDPELPPLEDREREYRFYRLLMQQLDGIPKGGFEHVVDVGCRNWSYVKVLAELLPNSKLLGVEVDGGRRFVNLHRRLDYARAYAAEVRGEGHSISLFFGDFLDLPDTAIVGNSLVLLFYPFVSERPCHAWGLPKRYVNFTALIEKIRKWRGEVPNILPKIFSVHQGEWEANLARQAYSDLGLKMNEKQIITEDHSDFWPSAHPCWIFQNSVESI